MNQGDNISGSEEAESDFFIYVPVFVDLWASMPLREGDSLDEVE